LLGDGSGDEKDVGDMGRAVISLSVQEEWVFERAWKMG